VKAVAPKPVNVVLGLGAVGPSLEELAAIGVKRISLGSSLARAAYGAFLQAGEEIFQNGTFTFANDTVPYSRFNKLF
jgi:2-methylisocitrate lyase-like PEP mutase family enzyme